MNRKKVLLAYELRSMIWFLAIGLGVIAIVLADMNMNIGARVRTMDSVSIGWRYFENSSGCVIGSILTEHLVDLVQMFLFGFLVMSMVQFGDLQSRERREYLNSLPFTQGEKFGIKVFVSYGIITLCCLVLSIGVIAMRIHYYPQIVKNNLTMPNFMQLLGADTMWHTVRSLLLFWITLLAMYSIIMTIQYLVRNSIVAALVAVGTLAFPPFVIQIAKQLVFLKYWIPGVGFSSYEKYNSALGIVKRIQRYVCTFWGDTMGYLSSEGGYERRAYTPVNWWNVTGEEAVSYGRMGISFAIVIVLLIAFTLFAWWISEHQDLARINRLVPLKNIRICLGAGLSVSIAAVIIFMASGAEMTMAIAILIWIVASAVLFFISQKILKRL